MARNATAGRPGVVLSVIGRGDREPVKALAARPDRPAAPGFPSLNISPNGSPSRGYP